jgi:hypothetical protein
MKTRLSLRIATLCSLLSVFLGGAVINAQEIYRDSGVKMGYISATESVSTDGYDQCFTSVGNYLWVRSDNSANQEPFFQVRLANNRVSIASNRYADGKGVYVCHNSRGASQKFTAGYVSSGTSIGAGLTCVVSVANFQKVRQGGAGTGTVECSYNREDGVITASQSGAGRISECGYICAQPGTATTAHLTSFKSTQASGSQTIGRNRRCAAGTNTFSSKCSSTSIQGALYDPTTGQAVLGFNNGCVNAYFSYLCSGGTECDDGLDNDGDRLSDRYDPGCWANPENPSSYDPNLNDEGLLTSQCQDGSDNDLDGVVDAADPGCWRDVGNSSTYDRTLNNEARSQPELGIPTQVFPPRNAVITAPELAFRWKAVARAQSYEVSVRQVSPQANQEVIRTANITSTFYKPLVSLPRGRYQWFVRAVRQAGQKGPWQSENVAFTFQIASQCSDGLDNDGDGVIDLQDFSCSGADDNDEASPVAQCQNGTDDDRDGLVDIADPGCSSPQDTNEADGTSQCQDGSDNDSDGVTDASDPGCWRDLTSSATYDRTLNNEARAQPIGLPTQVFPPQNGVISAPEVAFRWKAAAGAKTYEIVVRQISPANGQVVIRQASLTSTSYTPTTVLPRGQYQWFVRGIGQGGQKGPWQAAKVAYRFQIASQCSDGVDNDRDGAIDLQDFACSGPDDSDEASPVAQCQNGTDDDRDGLIDLADPGCSSPQDNNEGDGTSQCQNGTDDDRDGLIDLADPGCSSSQDTNEADGTSQCQNGVDDDRDGLIDGLDPGCSSPKDNVECDEVVPTKTPTPTATPSATCEVIMPTKTPTPTATPSATCEVIALTKTPTPTATTSATETQTDTQYKVTPIAECVDVLQDGSLLAHFGYRSDELSSVAIPYGPRNSVDPGVANPGQPTTFFRGAFSNVFTMVVPFATPESDNTSSSSVITWTLGSAAVEASAQTQRCTVEEISCNEADNKDTLSQLDNLASRQRSAVRYLASRIRRVSNASTFLDLAASYEEEAQDLYLAQWKSIWSSFPLVTKSCVGCAAIQTSSNITEITGRAKQLHRLTKRAASTLKKARRRSLSSSDAARAATGTTLYNRTLEVSTQLPRFNSQCS